METFSALLALCAGYSPVTGEFPTQRPVTRSFDVFFDLRMNKRLSKHSLCWWFETPPCSLWHDCNAFEDNKRVILFLVVCVLELCWRVWSLAHVAYLSKLQDIYIYIYIYISLFLIVFVQTMRYNTFPYELFKELNMLSKHGMNNAEFICPATNLIKRVYAYIYIYIYKCTCRSKNKIVITLNIWRGSQINYTGQNFHQSRFPSVIIIVFLSWQYFHVYSRGNYVLCSYQTIRFNNHTLTFVTTPGGIWEPCHKTNTPFSFWR